MKIVLIGFLALSLFSGILAIDRNSRILNGGPEAPGSALYYVHVTSLNSNGLGLTGGGTIISPFHVLTAASMVKGFSTFTLGYGSYSRATMKTANSTIAYYHYLYDSGLYDASTKTFKVTRTADIGIIAVSQALVLTPGSATIAKLSTGSPVTTSPYFYIHGFGSTGTSASSSTLLTGLTVTQAPCTNIVTGAAVGIFCTKAPNTNVCDGDFGGPVTDATGAVFGIASVSLGCASDTSAGHTDVFYYKSWITSMTNGLA